MRNVENGMSDRTLALVVVSTFLLAAAVAWRVEIVSCCVELAQLVAAGACAVVCAFGAGLLWCLPYIFGMVILSILVDLIRAAFWNWIEPEEHVTGRGTSTLILFFSLGAAFLAVLLTVR